MEENLDNIDIISRVPALAESEDIDSVGTDFDDAGEDVDVESTVPVIDRYGFSGGQQYTDPNKYVIHIYNLSTSL